MTPERWQEVMKLLAAALEREPAKRPAYLAEACTDPSLRREVESLIAANENGDSRFMEQPAVQTALKGGTKVGQFEILAPIGAGGMGEVYLAHDTKLGRDVAIKVLPAAFVHQSDRLVRFQREARVLAALSHPNIAAIYGLEQSANLHYLVMEFVRGVTLAQRLRAGPLPVRHLLDFSIQCADALDAAHAQGVIHRDIKPANIMVTERGQIKMLDFGLAKLIPRAVGNDSISRLRKEASLSQAGMRLGTLPYMSPEQARGEDLDVRTDLFSLGLVIYEMATGSAAFAGASTVILDAVLNRQPARPSQLNRAVPPKLEEIISRALEKDRNLRYQTAQDLRAELQRLKRDVETQTSAAGPSLQRRTGLYMKIVLSLGGLALALLLLFLAMLAPRGIPKVTDFYRITNDGRQKELPGAFYPILTDGTRLYFTQIGVGDLTFAQVSATGGETVLTETPFRFPRMADLSPDHAQLLLMGFAGSEHESTLWVQPILGGTPRRVGDLEGHDGTWSPTGEILYANGPSLYEAREDGNNIRKLATVPGIPFWPRWDPNGRVLRFSVLDASTNSTSLWEVLADGRNPHPLLPGWNDPSSECCGNWSPDGKSFAFQSTRDNQTNIWVLKENGPVGKLRNRQPVQVTGGPMNFLAPVFSRDGLKLFAIGEERRGELVRYDARAHEFVPYLSGISADRLTFSRDGKWVGYVSYPDETLWRSKVDGTQKQQLTFPPTIVDSPEWSPDGKEIAFSAFKESETTKIYLISADGGNPVEILPGKQRQVYPSWSADGQFLAFSGREPGATKSAIFLFNVKTNAVSAVPASEGLFDPRWSPDGKYIAAMTMDSQKLLLFNTQTRSWEQLGQFGIGYMSWSKDSNYLYIDTFGATPSVVRIGPRGLPLEKVVDLTGLHRAWGRYGPWLGLGPDDSPLATRDAGIQEIYASKWSDLK